MQSHFFDRQTLLSVIQSTREIPPALSKGAPTPSNEKFALAILRPGEDPSGLISFLYTEKPSARILEVTAPAGKDNLRQYRAMLDELLSACGEPPLRRGQVSALAAWLARLLKARYDYIIIRHAERLGSYSLDALRRDRGNPPVVLIAEQDSVLETILSREELLKRVVLLT